MPNSLAYKLAIGLFLVMFTGLGQAQEVGSRWLLQVLDLTYETKVEVIIRFLDESATKSCMAGEWRPIATEAKITQDEKFFPLSDPLSYKFSGDTLTLGRTNICDGYLFLSGKSDATSIQGQFNTVSIQGGQKRGYFYLTRVR